MNLPTESQKNDSRNNQIAPCNFIVLRPFTELFPYQLQIKENFKLKR